MKSKSYSFGCSVYPGTFIAVVGGGPKQIARAVRKHGKYYPPDRDGLLRDIDGMEDTLRVGWSVNHGLIDVIWLQRFNSKNYDDMLTLSHECLHAAYHRLMRIGVHVEGHNHEALAYLQQYLCRAIIRRFK